MHRSLATAGLLFLCLAPGVSWVETDTLTLRNGDTACTGSWLIKIQSTGPRC